jgi:hypothetical protein
MPVVILEKGHSVDGILHDGKMETINFLKRDQVLC